MGNNIEKLIKVDNPLELGDLGEKIEIFLNNRKENTFSAGKFISLSGKWLNLTNYKLQPSYSINLNLDSSDAIDQLRKLRDNAPIGIDRKDYSIDFSNGDYLDIFVIKKVKSKKLVSKEFKKP